MITGFKSLHPITMMTYYIAVFTTVMLVQDLLIYSIILFLFICNFMVVAGVGKTLKALKFPVIIGTLMVVVTPLLNGRGRHVLFHVFSRRITEEGIRMGLSMALSLVIILLLFQHYNLLVDDHKFLFVFGRFLPKVALLVTMTKHLVPVLLKRHQVIAFVRDLQLNPSKKFLDRLSESSARLLMLMGWSLERGIITADSMASRGYGVSTRSSYHQYRWHLKDSVVLSIILAIVIGVIISRISGVIYTSYYPVYNKMSITMAYSISGVLVGTLTSIPSFIEFKEVVKWRFIQLNS